VSRFSRLFPAFWAALLITTCVVYTRGLAEMRLPADEWAWNLTMMPKMFAADFLDGSYWTLEVELVFYAQMLLFWRLGWLRKPERIVAAWLGIALIAGLLRDAGYPLSFHTDQLLIPAHIPYFAMGVLFFRMQREGATALRLALLAACLVTVHLTLPAMYLWIGLGTAAVFGLFLGGWLRWLGSPPLVALGAISYPLYLVHQQVGTLLIYTLERRGWNGNASVAAAIALALALAYAVHRLVEKPALAAIRAAWKRRQALVTHTA
jgi:peptidoglycan/LPS O-acetylase OafA/YrhL